MKTPLVPQNEIQRLEALRSLRVLDTLPDQAIDDLTTLAADICGTPIALVSLIDSNRQWFKSRYGINASETPRELSFCAHAINQSETFLVANAKIDPRFFDHPMVVGGPKFEFYCGAVLSDENNYALGTICVVDYSPKILSSSQIRALELIGKQVMCRLRKRKFQSAERTINTHSLGARMIPCLAPYLDQLHSIVEKIEHCDSDSSKYALISELDKLYQACMLKSVSHKNENLLDEAETLTAFARSLYFFNDVIWNHKPKRTDFLEKK